MMLENVAPYFPKTGGSLYRILHKVTYKYGVTTIPLVHILYYSSPVLSLADDSARERIFYLPLIVVLE